MYRNEMAEVGIAQFRRELKDWLARARDGEEILVTERSRPVVRITGVGSTSLVDQLVEEGVLSTPEGPRPDPRELPRVPTRGSVSQLVVDERDARR